MLRHVLAVILLVSWVASSSAAEDWSEFNDCVQSHHEAAERAEPSLHDGARLIVDVLCNREATDLGNQMMRDPSRQDTVRQRGIGDGRSSARTACWRAPSAHGPAKSEFAWLWVPTPTRCAAW